MKTTQFIEYKHLDQQKVQITYTGQYNDLSMGQSPETRTHDFAMDLGDERSNDLGVIAGDTFTPSRVCLRLDDLSPNHFIAVPEQTFAKAAGYSVEVKEDGTLRVCLPAEVPPYLIATLAIFLGQMFQMQRHMIEMLRDEAIKREAITSARNMVETQVGLLTTQCLHLSQQLDEKRRMSFQTTTERKKAFMTGMALQKHGV